jgi:hypothetical protein
VSTRAPDTSSRARSTLARVGAIGGRALWAVVVVGSLGLLLRGLAAGVYIEPTGEALASARSGRVLVAVACCLLAGAALYAVGVAGRPGWVAAGLLAPVVLCGGLTLLAAETLFPQLAVLVAYPAALAGLLGGLLLRSR